MKRNALTLVVGVILLVIFFLLLFTFQVRQTEIVVLTTFAKPSAEPIDKPGLYFKWPLPIQKIYRFDKRIHNFEDAYEQMLTGDGHNLLASVYVGWTIDRPREFFNSFPAGTPAAAEPQLKSLVRSIKQAVIGQHPFSDFVSSDPKQVKFTEVEQEIFRSVQSSALTNYGVKVQFVGIKQLGIPENVTAKVFDRMTAERQREIEKLKAMGEREAIGIRSAADRDRAEILAQAEKESSAIKGSADAEAAKHFGVFQQNQELAVFLMQLKALESTLGKGATLVVDPSISPFNLLVNENTNSFAPKQQNSTAQPTRTLSAKE
ncbi:MAG: protease modulator HflC [Limisphaerales bacterium]